MQVETVEQLNELIRIAFDRSDEMAAIEALSQLLDLGMGPKEAEDAEHHTERSRIPARPVRQSRR